MFNYTHLYIRRFSCAALLFAVYIITGSATHALTLEEAHTLARQNNPILEALRAHSSAARARVGGAAALPDPKLQYTYFGKSVETRTGPQEAIYSLSQTVPWWSKLSTRKAIALQDADIYDLAVQAAEWTLHEAVTARFAEAHYLTKAIEATEAQLGWIQNAQQISEENVRGGGSLNALLQLEVEAERVRDEKSNYQQLLTTERAYLAALLSTDVDALEALQPITKPTQSLIDTAEQVELLRTQNPELLALQATIQKADKATQLSRLDRYPDFTLGLNYIQVGTGSSNFSDAGEDPWNVSIAISLPIWEGKNRAGIQSAKATALASHATYQNRLQHLKSELSAALSRQSDNFARMQRHESRLIPLAEQALENTHSAYKTSQVSFLEIIQSERALIQLRLSYWRALTNTIKTEATIQALTAQL